MDNTTIENSETVASQDGVVVRRKLSGTDGGLVGVIRISADGPGPVALVEMTQPFPEGLPVDDVGFQTGAEPESGEISADRAVIRQTIEDEDVEIKFGVKLAEPVEEVAFDLPVIEGVETARMTRSSAPRGDGSGAAGHPPDSPVTAVENPPEVGMTGTRIGVEAGGGRRSVEARLDWLSARVEEFAAYASSMEEMIDEHGTAPELIDRIEGDLAELEGRLDALREEHGDGMDELAGRADDIEQRLEAARAELEGELDDVRGRVEGVDGRVDDQGAAIADLEERLDGLESDLQGVRSSVEGVEDDLATATDDIQTVREELTSLREEVAELAEVSESVTEVLEPLAGGPLPHEEDGESEQGGQ